MTSRARLSRRDLITRSALALGSVALPSLRLRAQSVSPVMTTLSGYMAGAKDRALPPDVVENAKHHILDTFAAMLSGSELPPGRAALALARAQAGRPVATVVGSNILTGPIDAALVNGVLAHSDETDDSHGPSQSHPGASIVPAALALGEEFGRQRRALPARRHAWLRRRPAADDGARRRRRSGTRHAAARTRSRARSDRRRRRDVLPDLDRTADALAARLRVAAGRRLCDLGTRHRSHRKGIRLRRHAGAQWRDGGAARSLGLERRRRCVFRRATISSR